MSSVITLNKGSDHNFLVTWPEGTGGKNLAGYTVSAYDTHPLLTDNISFTITDAPNGKITGRIDWAETMPVGRVMYFRIRLTLGAETLSTPLIWLEVV